MRSLVVCLGAMSVALVACGGSTVPPAQQRFMAASDTLEVPLKEAQFLDELFVRLAPGGSPEETAKAAVSSAPQLFHGAGCVSARQSGAQVTYVLESCVGPSPSVSGTVVVTFLPSDPLSVRATVHSDRIWINGDYRVDAEVVHIRSDRESRLEVRTRSAIVDLGQERSLDGRYALARREGCLHFDGSWQTARGGHVTRAEVTDYRRCGGFDICPASGKQRLFEDGGAEEIVYDQGDAWLKGDDGRSMIRVLDQTCTRSPMKIR